MCHRYRLSRFYAMACALSYISYYCLLGSSLTLTHLRSHFKNNATLSSIPALILTFSHPCPHYPHSLSHPNKFIVLKFTPVLTHSGPHTPSHPARSLTYALTLTPTLAFSRLLILTAAHLHICSFYTSSHSPSHLFILTLAHSQLTQSFSPSNPLILKHFLTLTFKAPTFTLIHALSFPLTLCPSCPGRGSLPDVPAS